MLNLIRQRSKELGIAGLVVGTVILIVGVWWVHYTSIPETVTIGGVTTEVQVDYFGWLPRGCMLGSVSTMCLPWFTLGHIAAFIGSQLMLAGALLLWFIDKPLTWSRASFASFIVWIELVLIFGNVPSEWLNLTQGPLNWTEQNIAFTVPPFLVLGNAVEVSWAAIKDFISINYNMAALTAALIIAYKVQDWNKESTSVPADVKTSPYGRPLVKTNG